MANATEKQLADLAAEKASLKKRIESTQARIAVIEKMEAALGGPVKPEASAVAAAK